MSTDAHGRADAHAAAPPLLPLEQARASILAGVEALAVERVPLADAAGRILAAPVVSRQTLPPWDNTAMDGFAVRSADVAGASAASPVVLRVIGEVAAGRAPAQVVEPGTALRIATGAMIPNGADAIARVEDTDAAPGESGLPESVAIRVAAAPGDYIRRAGEDLAAGTSVLEAGRVLGPAPIALLAAIGEASVEVHRLPRVAVLSTGDELVPVGQPLGPAQIHDSNAVALVAQARAAGAEARGFGVARDAFDDLLARLREAVAWADVVVVSGGVSVGAHDLVKRGFSTVGSVDLWRVAIKPGKPLAFGRAREGGRDVLLFGLPGNPVSVFVTFELFVRPVIRVLAGRPDPFDRPVRRARLLGPVEGSPARRVFVRVRLSPDPDRIGMLLAVPSGGQGSHVLSALAVANGLAAVPEGVLSLPVGAEVDAWEIGDEGT